MAPLEQFILLGDSLTQGANDQSRGFGLASELQAAYVRRLDVINRGFSGYNTDHILTVLNEILPTPEQAPIKFLTIWFGANDANTCTFPIDQYVPLDSFKSNLKAIITHPAVKVHAPNIILFTPPPVEESIVYEAHKQMNADLGHEGEVVIRKAVDAKAYAGAVREVGEEMRVAVVDVWGICMKKAGWKEGDEVLPGTREVGRNEVLAGLLYDGLHLNPDGYKAVFEELVKVMKEKWPEYPPYKMPYAVKVPWEVELGDKMWDVHTY